MSKTDKRRQPRSPDIRAKIATSQRMRIATEKGMLASASLFPGTSADLQKLEILTAPNLIESYSGIFNSLPSIISAQGILNSSNNGIMMTVMEMFDYLAKADGHLIGLVDVRKNAVSNKPVAVRSVDPTKPSNDLAEFIRKCVAKISNLEQGINNLLDAVYRGVAVCEIGWGYDPVKNMYIPIELIEVPGKTLRFDEDLELVFNDQFHPELNGKRLRDIPNKFIIHTPAELSPFPNQDGLYRNAIFNSIIKHFCYKMGLNAAERFANPIMVATVGRQADKENMNDLVNKLSNTNSTSAIVLKEGIALDINNTGQDSGNSVYFAFMNYADTQNTKLVSGGTLTMEAGDGGHSYALGEVHERSRQDLLESDGKKLCRTLERDLFSAIYNMNKHLIDPAAEMPLCYLDGLVEYKDITDADIQTGIVRRNDLRRQKGLPEISQAEGGEDFIIPDLQQAAILGLLEKVNIGAIKVEQAKRFMKIANKSLSEKQIDELLAQEIMISEPTGTN